VEAAVEPQLGEFPEVREETSAATQRIPVFVWISLRSPADQGGLNSELDHAANQIPASRRQIHLVTPIQTDSARNLGRARHLASCGKAYRGSRALNKPKIS